MKRALAARAKHDPNGLAPAPAAVVSSSPKKPAKIPRIEIKSEEPACNNSSSNSNITSIGSGSSGLGLTGVVAVAATSVTANTVIATPVLTAKSQQPPKPKQEPVSVSSSGATSTPGSGSGSSSLKPSNGLVSSSSVQQTKSTPVPASSSSTTVKQSSLPASPRPNKPGRPSMKRQRVSQAPAADEDDETGAFFLKHQNAALSSELQQLRFQFSLLEKERDFRRTQCQDASQVLHSLEATWTAMEVALQLGQQPAGTNEDNDESEGTENTNITLLSEETPRSTGTGESVELIGALLDSLAAIANEPKPIDGDTEEGHLRDISKTADSVSKRATALQRWIWGLLRKVTAEDESGKHPLLKLAKLEAKMSALKSQVRDFQTKLAEIAKCRDDAVESERKVRRGLYRLNAGRMKLDEVMEAIETADKDGSAALMVMEENPPAAAVQAQASDEDGEPIDNAHVAQLRKQVRDLEEISSSREKQIDDLTKEREGNLKRINELALSSEQEKSPADSVVSEDDIKRSELFTNTWTRMTTVERQLSEAQSKLGKAKESWAAARGDAEHATKSLEEHLLKHKKRWAELTETPESENGNGDDGVPIKPEMLQQAEMIVELEHKLKQALENVRRADVVRVSLEETTQMNDAFQARLDDLKSRNSALIAAAKQQSLIRHDAPSSSSKEVDKTPSKQETPSMDKAEKMHKEHRRMRKDLAAAMASKENAKARLEKSEKDREHLIKTNSRLVKQSAEKDEMNAKSLSTILHLKSVTEKLSQERELMELQAKSAGQVNVAARLAANAKERVSDEAIAQRIAFEEQITALEQACEKLRLDNEKAVGSLAQKKAEMSDLEKDAASAKARCDELVAGSTKQQEEKRKILESLAVAQREAGDSAKQIVKMRSKSGSAGGHSDFTTEQLETQVSVLKHRLSCPVCNHRDKSCIVLRCRHMFCKHCIDELIKNRNRKCPSCGQRFDTKDVEDIWL